MPTANDGVDNRDCHNLTVSRLGDTRLGAAIESKEAKKENKTTQSCELYKKDAKTKRGKVTKAQFILPANTIDLMANTNAQAQTVE